MALPRNLFRRLTSPAITSRRELTIYVITTTAVCLSVALAADVINQLTFFDGWPATLRSWTVTTFVALIIAAPVSWSIGRAHLELHRAKVVADELGRTDPLTGLPNRRAVFEFAERTNAQAMVLVIFDIDRFKRVNDSYGHLVGDDVIRGVGHMMAEALGSLGYIGRIGGEEFMLVSTAGDTDRLVAGLSSFRARLNSTPIVSRGGGVVVTMSVGAALRGPGVSLNELYAEADRALYAAKSYGRNRITYSHSFEMLEDRTLGRDEAMWREDADAEFHRRASDDGQDFSSVA